MYGRATCYAGYEKDAQVDNDTVLRTSTANHSQRANLQWVYSVHETVFVVISQCQFLDMLNQLTCRSACLLRLGYPFTRTIVD